jgi:hypothetical protein
MNKFPAELADFRRFSTFLGGISETYCSHLFTQLSIIIQEVDDECLVYDVKTHKALCLNTVSAEIWKRCDGTTTVQEVAEMIGKQMNIKLDKDFVWLAIADLEKNKLLIGEVKRPSEFENLSRRKVLFKYALPTLILPLISSIVAPTPVNAQSATACPAIPPGCTGGDTWRNSNGLSLHSELL